jgi:hypothetical protein
VCRHGGPEDATLDHERSIAQDSRFTIHAWFGQCLWYSEDDDGAASVKVVNVYTKKSELPDGVHVIDRLYVNPPTLMASSWCIPIYFTTYREGR